MRAAPAPLPARSPWRESAGIAAFLGWVVPGLGHLWVGRPGKALHYLVVVGGTYALGLALSGFLAVSFERHPVWLAAQVWLAGPTVAAAWLTQDVDVARRVPLLDVGQLYVAVASLLNLVAVADAVGVAEALTTRRRRLVDDAAGAATAARLREAALRVPAEGAPSARPATAAQDEWPPPAALEPAATATPLPPPGDAP